VIKRDLAKPITKQKRVSSNYQKSDQMNIDAIRHLPDQDQAEIIADKFSTIQNEYEPLRTEDILSMFHSLM
jgi:hypothetical protein